jgi:hypothetical protein
VQSILKHRIDEQHSTEANPYLLELPAEHDNLRGPDYYN